MRRDVGDLEPDQEKSSSGQRRIRPPGQVLLRSRGELRIKSRQRRVQLFSQPQVRSVVCRELVALGEDKNGTYLDGVSLQVECRISIEAGEYSALGQPFATQFLYGYVGNLVVHQLRCAQCAGLQKCRSLLLLGFAEQCGGQYRRVYHEARATVVGGCRLCHPEADGNGRPDACVRHCSATVPHGPDESHRACGSLGKQLARLRNHLIYGDVAAGRGSGEGLGTVLTRG